MDVVLHFDGDRHAQLRMVRALKNRFGPTDEIGCFELGEFGLAELPDPSGLFLSRLRDPVPGTCVTVTLEGRRPLLAEVQTLICEAVSDPVQRRTSGLDSSRVGDARGGAAGPGQHGDRQEGRVRGDRRRCAPDRTVCRPGDRALAGQRAVQAEPARRPHRDRRGRAGRRDPPGHRRAAAARGSRADGVPARDRAARLAGPAIGRVPADDRHRGRGHRASDRGGPRSAAEGAGQAAATGCVTPIH